ncbi:MAG TPA: tetratricopeptide repeat protein [Verrucomicrobiae bacterium]|jgi:tetratricopeptide (TPR) repeat protein|nr:tetratricopeptide repeat protein [Verrucomicrobiae bacterium]
MLQSLVQAQNHSGDDATDLRSRRWFVCLVLALLIAAAYSPVVNCDFVDYDDSDYVTNNPNIRGGLTWQGISWAFTTGWAANWHPLTWISHMIDYDLFHGTPLGSHLGNVALHIANSVLLLLCLEYLTGAFWRSAVVAAFFAFHPLHVESVAWVAERKDVLSTFFWIIAVWLYAAYARRDAHPDRRRKLLYSLALAAFALGLLAKQMVVTLPCFLLLLDFWPLRRHVSARQLLVEKIPFVLLSAGASIATIIAQSEGGAVQSLVKYSLSARLANVPVAYMRYLGKIFWPAALKIFYPYVQDWSPWLVTACAAGLAAVTVFALRRWRRQPYLAIGWFWFLGILVPTIGIVQVGEQSIADRYTYVPSVGIFIMVVWSAADASVGRALARWAGAVAASAAVSVCFVLTFFQVGYWHDTGSLFGHAAAVGANNYLAYYNLGSYLAKLRDTTNAIFYLKRCIEIDPSYPRAYNNLAYVEIEKGQWDEAITNLRHAVLLRPLYPEAWVNLGRAYTAKGEPKLAIESFEKSLVDRPDSVDTHFRLADLFIGEKEYARALSHLRAVVAQQPRNGYYHAKLANGLVAARNFPDAINEYEIALKLQPDMPDACNNLAWILATSTNPAWRDGPLAVGLSSHAVKLTGGSDPLYLGTLAASCAEDGRFDDAAHAASTAEMHARLTSNAALAASLAAQTRLYQNHQPFRDANIQ